MSVGIPGLEPGIQPYQSCVIDQFHYMPASDVVASSVTRLRRSARSAESAVGGSRTHTPLRARPSEDRVSTSSTTTAWDATSQWLVGSRRERIEPPCNQLAFRPCIRRRAYAAVLFEAYFFTASASGVNRTRNLLIKSQLLYQLSYGGMSTTSQTTARSGQYRVAAGRDFPTDLLDHHGD